MTNQLAAIRTARGWTREYVAAAVGITAEAVRLLETGRRKPSYDVLCKLEELFGLNHRDLFRVSGGGTSTA